MKQRVFLSFDFDYPHVERWFRDIAKDVLGGQVEVIVANEYRARKTQNVVEDKIKSCDVVFCLLTRHAAANGRSIPSAWVLSEALFGRDHGKRVAAMREPGIEMEALGLAFEAGLTVPEFSPQDLPKATEPLRQLLRDVIHPVVPFETRHAHKIVRVKRNGFVHCSLRYTQMVFRPEEHRSIDHCIWRTHQQLPKMHEFQFGHGTLESRPYLDAWRIVRGSRQGRTRLKINSPKFADEGRQLYFSLDLEGQELQPFGLFEYEFAWGYGSAFLPRDVLLGLEAFPLNSAGLLAGTAGEVTIARLELRFERPPEDQDLFEKAPSFSVASRAPRSNESSVDYWRCSSAWSTGVPVSESLNEPTPEHAVYSFENEHLHTTIRATWQPTEDYHIPFLPEQEDESVQANELSKLEVAGSCLADSTSSSRHEVRRAVDTIVAIMRNLGSHSAKVQSTAVELAVKHYRRLKKCKTMVRKWLRDPVVSGNRDLEVALRKLASLIDVTLPAGLGQRKKENGEKVKVPSGQARKPK